MCGHTGVFFQTLQVQYYLGFEFALYLNPNPPRGSGSGILLNLIPEPQVQNWVQKVWEPDHSQSITVLPFLDDSSGSNLLKDDVKVVT